MFPAALACAAMLMGQPVPPVSVVVVTVEAIPASVCGERWGGNCGAAFAPVSRDRGVIVTAYPDNFRLMVHEAAHVVQNYTGRPWRGPAAEREAEAIAARAGTCRPATRS